MGRRPAQRNMHCFYAQECWLHSDVVQTFQREEDTCSCKYQRELY